MIVRKRYPNYVTGLEVTEHDVNSKKELHEIDWIKNWMMDGWTIAYCPKQKTNQSEIIQTEPDYLIGFKSKESYFVIGYIFGDGLELGLSNYENLI